MIRELFSSIKEETVQMISSSNNEIISIRGIKGIDYEEERLMQLALVQSQFVPLTSICNSLFFHSTDYINQKLLFSDFGLQIFDIYDLRAFFFH